MLTVLDPLAEIAPAPEGQALRPVDSLEGKRMGLLWSQHASSVKFWPVFERVVQEMFRPSSVHRLYKTSSWNVAPSEDIRALTRNVDFVFVGVGG